MVQPLPPISVSSPAMGAGMPLSSTPVPLQILSVDFGPATPRGTDSIIKGRIDHIAPDHTVRITTDQGMITARLPDQVRVQSGQPVEIHLAAQTEGNKPPVTIQTPQTPPPVPERAPAANPSDSLAPSRPPAASASEDPVKLNASLRNLSTRPASAGASAPPPLQPGQTVQLRALTLPALNSLLKPQLPAAGPAGTPLTSLTAILDSILPPAFSATSPLFSGPGAGMIRLPLSALGGFSQLAALSLNAALFSPFQGSAAASRAPFFLAPPTTESARALLSNLETQPFKMPGPETGSFKNFLFPTRFDVRMGAPLLQLSIESITRESLAFLTPPGGGPSPANTPGLSALNQAGAPAWLVLARGAGGLTILAEAGNEAPALYRLDSTAPLPAGSVLRGTAAVSPSLLPGSSFGPADAAEPLALLLSELNDLLNLPLLPGGLEGITPRLPLPTTSAPQHLGPALLFFIAALRAGDFQGWVGERALDSLRRTTKGAALLEKLEEMFSSLRARTAEPAAGEWRAAPVPLQIHQQILPVHFYQHRGENSDAPDDPEKSGPGSQRFVLDLNFDRMGAVQMDMLYQPGRLDSILRTQLPLSQAMRGVLEVKYAGAMSKTGLTGTLNFQDGPAKWVTVTPGSPGDLKVTA